MASVKQGASIVILGFILAIMGTAFMPTIAEQVNASADSLSDYSYDSAADVWVLLPLVIAASGIIFVVAGVLLTLL